MSNFSRLEHRLAEQYLATRPNLQVRNPGFCVFFAAVPGSGKSTLRQALVERFQATYFCNDEVRNLIAAHPKANPAPVIGNIVLGSWAVILNHHQNHFVVFDNTISQYHHNYDSYLNTARRRQLPTYIVSIDLPRETLRERIINRGVNVQALLADLDSALAAQAAARKSVEVDYSFTQATRAEDLFADIQHRLTTHRSA